MMMGRGVLRSRCIIVLRKYPSMSGIAFKGFLTGGFVFGDGRFCGVSKFHFISPGWLEDCFICLQSSFKGEF